jgi:hypothetical protein
VEIEFARDSDHEYILRSSVMKRERERERGAAGKGGREVEGEKEKLAFTTYIQSVECVENALLPDSVILLQVEKNGDGSLMCAEIIFVIVFTFTK